MMQDNRFFNLNRKFVTVVLAALVLTQALPSITLAIGDGKSCDVVFDVKPDQGEENQSIAQQYQELHAQYVKSIQGKIEDLRNQPEIRGQKHPRKNFLGSIDLFGSVQNKLYKSFPPLKRIEGIEAGLERQKQTITLDQYYLYYRNLLGSIRRAEVGSVSSIQTWAEVDALDSLLRLSQRVQLPQDLKPQKNQQQDQDKKDEQNQQQQQQEEEDKNQKDKEENQNQQQGQQGQQNQNQTTQEGQRKEKKEDEQQQQKSAKESLQKIDEESQDEYDIHNKDIQSDSSKERPQFAYMYLANVPNNLLRATSFDVLGQHLKKNLSIRSPHIKGYVNLLGQTFSQSMLVTNQQRAEKLVLPYPYEVRPVVGDYGAFVVKETFSNEFVVEAKPGTKLPKKIKIGLQPELPTTLSLMQQNEYTSKSGIQLSQWPDHVQSGLSLAKVQADSIKQVSVLSEWFKKHGPYLYNSRSKKMEESYDQVQQQIKQQMGSRPLELILAEVKMFNCDGAALIGARLVRDQLGLPARIVGGRTISALLQNRKGLKILAVNARDPKHAWVEVFINGRWMPFDFTPEKNAPQPEGQSENRHEKQQDPSQNGKSQQSSSAGSSSGNRDEGIVNQTQREAGQQMKAGDQIVLNEEKPPIDKTSKRSETQKNPKDSDSDTKSRRRQDFVKENIHEVSQLPKDYDSVVGALMRQINADALNLMRQKGPSSVALNEAQTALGSIKGNERSKSKAKLDLQADLEPFFRENDKSITDLIGDLKTAIFRDPTTTFSRLIVLNKYYSAVSRYRELSGAEKDFQHDIQEIMSAMSRFKHVNSSQHELVSRFLDNMPGEILKEMVKEKYPQSQAIGSMDQQALFKELTAGNWKAAFEASLVNKHFNFFLNAEKEHRIRRIQTALRSFQRERRSEGLVVASLKDIADFQRWILDPEISEDTAMTFLSKLMKDEQYMMGNRQMVNAPGRAQPIERKHTNIFFDISGSMNGQGKDEVQSAALIAMVDRFLSEKDPFGKPLHTVMLFPFGSEVHQGLLIESREQALSYIKSNLNRPTQATESTEFQPCFNKHFEIVQKLAQDNSLRIKLKKTNMVLITDGEGDVDLDRVKKDIHSLPDGVKTFFNLVTLNDGRNESLEKIVAQTNSEKSKSMLTQITFDQMTKFQHEANNPEIDPQAFVYDKQKGSLTSEITQLVQKLQLPGALATDYQSIVYKHRDSIRSFHHINPEPTCLTELVRMRDQMKNSTIPQELKIKWTAAVLYNYSRWFHHNLNQVSYAEEAVLLDIIKLAI